MIPQLSVFFFAHEDTESGPDRYRFVLDIAALADELGFAAVWLPERHFHPFGGLFPNPAVVAAAVAARTSRIAVRAGSVVAPLHHATRIAEEWAAVDALSNGRAGVSLASGWNRADFVSAPQNFERRREILLEHVDTLRALWRREAVEFPESDPVRTYPAPVGPTIPLWLTATSGPATFRAAAARGLNVLTAYLQLDRAALAEHVAEYRATFQGEAPHVTLMAHACVADSMAGALRAVERPLIAYQGQFLDLHQRGQDGEPLTEEEKYELARYAARKYATDRGLIGGPDEVVERLHDLASIGVDEVACLVDFGLPADVVADTLRRLAKAAQLS